MTPHRKTTQNYAKENVREKALDFIAVILLRINRCCA